MIKDQCQVAIAWSATIYEGAFSQNFSLYPHFPTAFFNNF